MIDGASIRRARMAASPALFRGSFRPFFLGSAIWALVALILFICALTATITLPTTFTIIAWHRHEMLFGYLGAVIAGFLLTAIPNWTGRLPIAGLPLAALAGLWLAARIAVLCSAVVGAPVAAVLDVGFFLTLAFVAGREVLIARNRNLPVVGLVLLLALANGLDHAETMGAPLPAGIGYRFAITLIVVMIGLVGGRIVPSFTRNWLAKQGAAGPLPGQPGRFDIAVLALTALALLSWTLAPDAHVSSFALLLAGAAQSARLLRWQGYRTLREPIVLILHIAYFWIPVGLVLLGLSIVTSVLPASAALHALTAGAMAGMTLAVMTRATRGHTGHDLTAGPMTVALYALITLAAAIRVTAPVLPISYLAAIHTAALAWIGAFVLFIVAYGPMLALPRQDGKL
ncbi:MAG: NnrS family protein [Sphingomonadales bacterium]|nr:NnrS family protein [Sphingomonadales bacterium]MDE2171533.1 NnrS family protein [Sphingomonadales bacterium]